MDHMTDNTSSENYGPQWLVWADVDSNGTTVIPPPGEAIEVLRCQVICKPNTKGGSKRHRCMQAAKYADYAPGRQQNAGLVFVCEFHLANDYDQAWLVDEYVQPYRTNIGLKMAALEALNELPVGSAAIERETEHWGRALAAHRAAIKGMSDEEREAEIERITGIVK